MSTDLDNIKFNKMMTFIESLEAYHFSFIGLNKEDFRRMFFHNVTITDSSFASFSELAVRLFEDQNALGIHKVVFHRNINHYNHHEVIINIINKKVGNPEEAKTVLDALFENVSSY